jgi:uncharacterized protein YggE
MTTRTGAVAALGALLLGGAALAACGGPSDRAVTTVSVKQATKCQSGTPTVTVQGNASAEGAPDQATIALGVQTQAATAAAAMNANAAKANALVARIEADGVAKADLQTSGLSVQPNYNANGTVITSYQVTNSLTVTLNNLSIVGTVIDDAGKAAGNAVRVDSIAFAVQNETALLGKARAAAVEQAAGQAAILASSAGMVLGPLCSLTDNSSPPGPSPVYSGSEPESAAASTPIEAGTFQVTANVTVVYQLGAGTLPVAAR